MAFLWMRMSRCPLVGVACAAMAGIWVAEISQPDPWLSTAAALACALLAARRRWAVYAMVFIAFASMHAWTLQRDGASVLAASVPQQGVLFLEGEAVVWDAPLALASADTWQCPIRVRTVIARGQRHPVDVKVMMVWKGPPPAYGDRVHFRGTLMNIQAPRNPGQFDARSFYKREGIYSRLFVRHGVDARVLDGEHGLFLKSWALRARDRMETWLRLDLHDAPSEAEVIASIVLGAGDSLAETTKTKFRHTGTLHLFAVSGLHVGMVALLLLLVLRLLPVRRARLFWLIVPLLVFYALITGLRPSVVRATVMTVLVMGGLLLDRRGSIVNNLAAAALLLLAWDSNQMFTPGFQLSFAVVASIVLLAGPLSRKALRLTMPDSFLPEKLWTITERGSYLAGRYVGGLAAVASAAWIGSAPWMLWGFNLITPLSVLANMIAVPLAFLVLGLGLLATVAAPLAVGLAMVFNNSNWLVAKTMLAVIDFFASLQGTAVRVGTQRLPADLIAELRVFDAGTGGAVALQSRQQCWLLDSGNEQFARSALMPALWQRGVNRLDGLFLSHGDARHLGGAVPIVEEFRPRRILQTSIADRSSVRRSLLQQLAQWQMGAEHVRRDMRVQIGHDVHIRVLHPQAGMEKRLADDKAMVLLVQAGTVRMLLLSDSGMATTRWLAEQHPKLRCDVVVRGRHARDFMAHPGFIESLGARVVVTEATDPLSRSSGTREVPIRTRVRHFRQEQTGAVSIRIYRDRYEVESYVTGELFTNRAR